MNSKINIENDDDLNGMAPHLFKVNTNSPFKADGDYFDGFTSKLQNKINDFEEIKSEAPLLANIPKYNPFEVPKDYFDYLPSRIQEAVIKTKSATSITEWLILVFKPRFALPFLVTLFLSFAGMNYMNSISTLSKNEVAEEITTEEQLLGIDESTIIESVNTNETNENKITTTEDALIQNYLIENNIDENNL